MEKQILFGGRYQFYFIKKKKSFQATFPSSVSKDKVQFRPWNNNYLSWPNRRVYLERGVRPPAGELLREIEGDPETRKETQTEK